MKNKLIKVLSIQSESYNQWRMFAYIIRELTRLKCNYYVKDGNIYATKGIAKKYPCIVSHIDTVHSIVEDLTVLEINGNLTGFNAITMQQTGIGGDDKVGIFIALQCIDKFDIIKSVFFRDEEVGCNGSYDSDFAFFDDCKFILQCDRKGNKDFITNASGVQLSNKDFQNDISHILKKHKYSLNAGMMTDVMALKESGVQCSMANISCGYYNPHCENEYVNINDVYNCLSLVIGIISFLKKSYYCKYEYLQPVYKKSNRFNSSLEPYYFGQDDGFEHYAEMKNVEQNCECCEEKALLTYVSDFNIEMCNKCIKDYIKPYGT